MVVSKNKADATPVGTVTSGANPSFWTAHTPPLFFEPLKSDVHADAVIVGAGIAGLSAAYFLAKNKLRVVVVEDGAVGSGETGRTTAHFTYVLDDRFAYLQHIHGEKGVRNAVLSHKAAIQAASDIVAREQIECDAQKLDGYLFLDPDDSPETLDKDYAIAKKLNLPVQRVKRAPLRFDTGLALRFSDQFELHPLKYLKGLCKAIQRMDGTIYTNTHADSISEKGVVANGHTVHADHVVVATNTPVHTKVAIHAKQAAYRTYACTFTVPRGSVEAALYWDTGKKGMGANPYHYVRVQPYSVKTDALIVGGEDHKTGQANEHGLRFDALKRWAKARFPIEKTINQWSGQVMEPMDGLGYIGKSPGEKNVYLITGDSGNGMTNGTLGGLLVTDLIRGRHNAWTELYDPSRKPALALDVITYESVNVLAQYADYLKGGAQTTRETLKPGEGAVIVEKGKHLAVSKDARGKLCVCSAICPHLKCIVRWNAGEKTFDCPCHGSRFTATGAVIHGPANGPLEPAKNRR